MHSYFSSVFYIWVLHKFSNIQQSCWLWVIDHCLQRNWNFTYSERLQVPRAHLPPRVLKECTAEKAPSFSIVLNKSLTTGSLRYAWRQADIVPTHKKGSKTDKENYGQISLTSIACKVCEKIVKQRVINFWQDLGVLNEIQFGFLEGKSTVTQLPLLTSYFSISLKRSIQSPRCACWLWNRGQPVALV